MDCQVLITTDPVSGQIFVTIQNEHVNGESESVVFSLPVDTEFVE